MKFAFYLFLISIVTHGCYSKSNNQTQRNWDALLKLEISYNDGHRKVHFSVDSSRIFHSLGVIHDTIYYGNTPVDAVLQIDSIISILRTEPFLNTPVNIYHAQRISIMAIIQTDTIRFIQGSNINSNLVRHILYLDSSINKNKSSYFTLSPLFETAEDVYDLPPRVE